MHTSIDYFDLLEFCYLVRAGIRRIFLVAATYQSIFRLFTLNLICEKERKRNLNKNCDAKKEVELK